MPEEDEDEEVEEDDMPMDVWRKLFMRPIDLSKIKIWREEDERR